AADTGSGGCLAAVTLGGGGGCTKATSDLSVPARAARVRAVLGGGMLGRGAAWGGVDVGGKGKGFDVAVIDDCRLLALQSHLTPKQVVDLAMGHRPAVIAIDSPRCCAPEGQTARDGERQLAKSICGIRWTPGERQVYANPYYAWILEGL